MSEDVVAQLAELRAAIGRIATWPDGPDWATVTIVRDHLGHVAVRMAAAGRRDLAERLTGIAEGAGAPSGGDAAATVADIAGRVATLS